MKIRRYTSQRCLIKLAFVCALVVTMFTAAHVNYERKLKLIRESALAAIHADNVMDETQDVSNLPTHEENRNIERSFLEKVRSGVIEYPNEKYHVIPDLLSSFNSGSVTKDNAIVICTQTSLGNLHRIESLAEKWGGEVSVAVFTFDDEVPLALEYIMLLHKCSSVVRRKTRFHLAYPMDHPPINLKSIFEMDFLCTNLPKLQNITTAENYNLNDIPYPVNLLRNIAFMYSSGPYVFNLDIDFTPAKNMRLEMEAFLEKRPVSEKLKKTAFIIPCFESDSSRSIQSKKDLLEAIKKKAARQFTYYKCYRCHHPTNYSKWISLPYPSEMKIGYFIKFEMPHEPYFIADRNRMPMFDSRFKQYGINRVSQICESFYSGYDFAVMNNAFVLHDGFKDPELFHPWKKTQNKFNRGLFDTIFKEDLKLRHPNSTRECVYMQMKAGTMPDDYKKP